MQKMRAALFLLPISPMVAACAHSPETFRAPAPSSDFVGIYNGNSFETAMGMRIAEDGSFEWGLSVGALDMRAKGTWEQLGETIRFNSVPRPVPPEFGWSGLEKGPDSRLVTVVWATNGKPFPYASIELQCAGGKAVYAQVPAEGWSPDPAECPDPVSLQLREDIHDVVSQRYALSSLGWEPGMTMRFDFRPNDLGLADFTGVTGRLRDSMLTLEGARWPLELRKVERNTDEE